MRNIKYTIAFAVMMVMTMVGSANAAAVAPLAGTGTQIVGGAAGSALPFLGAVGLAAAAVVAIQEGYDPWTPNFKDVSYDYPSQHVKEANYNFDK